MLPAPCCSPRASAHARKTPARASDSIGTHIEDAAGHDIATIKDLVVCSSGQVVAVVEVNSRDDAMVGVPLGQLYASWLKSCEFHDAAGTTDKQEATGTQEERIGDGHGVGDVKDLAIDLCTGEAVYVIVSTGGVLGMGTSLHAIPFKHLTINERDVVIPMTSEGLSRLPKLDLDRLPAGTAMATVPERGQLATH